MANESGALVNWLNRRVHTERASFGQVQYRAGGYCGPRIQGQFQLVLLHSGTCRVAVDDVEREIALGEVHLFLPKHRELFSFSPIQPSEHSWCSIQPELLPRSWARDLRAARSSAVISPVFQRLLSLALNLGVSPDKMAERVVEQLALTLFAEYLNMSRLSREPTRSEFGMVRALEHLEEKYGEANCLRDLARASGFSRSTLGRRFRATTGLSPTRYLWRLRTEKGVAMLRETGLPAFEIAARCGFSNPFHFSRYVRRTTGESPRAIRARAWAGP
jgi:AraC-like DNA-binding protein